MHLLATIKKYIKLLNPEPKIGGLEITDTAIRFLMIEAGGEAFTVSLRMPPGAIVRGRPADPDQIARALRDVRARIGRSKRPVPVIVLLPPELAYVQAFSLPALPEAQVAEAAALNLEMLSPFPIEQVYASSERIAGAASSGNQMEFLAAFAERAAVDTYLAALDATGFAPVAVEFPALAVSRLAAHLGADLDPAAPALLVHIMQDGVSMAILRSRNLSFHHFTPWQEIREAAGGRELTLRDLAGFFEREIQRFLNFYTSRWGGAIQTALLLTQELGDELREAIASRFFSLRVLPFRLREFRELPPLWFPVLGAAKRGELPRSRDGSISLAAESAQAQYVRERVFAFAGLWRTVFITLAAFFLVAFVAVDSFIAREEVRLRARIALEPPPADAARIASLEAEARSFNELTARALRARERSAPWSPLFTILGALVGENGSLRRIAVQDGRVTVTGVADSAETAAALRARFMREARFSDIAFPLANIKENADGTASWSVAFGWATPPVDFPSPSLPPGLIFPSLR